MHETIDINAAIAGGYRPLTAAYNSNEYGMLARVIADLRRGRVAYALIREERDNPTRISVYRK